MRSFLFAGLACLILPTLVSAQIFGARPLQDQPDRARIESPGRVIPGTRAWSAVRPPLGVKILYRLDQDKGQQSLVEARFPAARLLFNNERLEDWIAVPTPSRYAIEWTNQWKPELTFGVAEAPDADFSTPLDQADWNTYLAKLRAQYGSRLRLLGDDDSTANQQMIRPFGGRTRLLDFEIAPAKPDFPVYRVVQLFTVFPRGVLVFGYEGPADDVKDTLRDFVGLVTRVELEANAN